MNATSGVIPPAPLFYRLLEMALSDALNSSNSQRYETQVSLPPHAREELRWWDSHMVKWEITPFQGDRHNRLRCLTNGLGLSMSRSTDRRSMVSGREPDAHKLPQLLAASLTFLKYKSKLSVLLRLDNTSALAYINNLGGTVSPELVDLAKTQWMWCLERNIHITAQHLPGVQNHIADVESWTMVDRSDWKLNPILFKRIINIFGPIEVDQFASRLTDFGKLSTLHWIL